MTAAAALSKRAVLDGAGLALAVAAALTIIEHPSSVRLLVTAVLLLVLVPLAVTSSRHAVVATMLVLPFLAVARRILLDFEPWRTLDPLLLISGIVALTLLVQMFVVEGRRVGGDRLSALVIALLVLTVLQAANPRGGSLAAGGAALLFAGVPLLWFFVGRELVDDATLRVILSLVIPVGLIAALYGLLQTEHGLPHWDEEWLNGQSAYAALAVGNRVRAFGIFSSAAEYAAYLAVAIIASLTFVRRLWLLPAFALPVLGVALFLESSRGVIVTLLAAAAVVAGVWIAGRRGAVMAVAVAAAVVVGGLHSFGGQLQSQAAASGNPLVTHQVEGLVDPLNPQQSTLLLHWHGLVAGLSSGLHSPLGHGIAATTIAGVRLGGSDQGAEIDIANAFVGLGAPGGIVYLAIVLMALCAAVSVAARRRDALSLAALGILVVTLGQWLNGGYYAVSALVWIVLGWLTAARSRTTTRATR